MLKNTLNRLSGGHGDLFPTSKAAAHLEPKWVMSREKPAAPGKGMRYVQVTHPARKSSKFQLNGAESHETVKMVIGHAPPPHCTTAVPSNTSVAGAIGGANAYMREYHHAKDFSSPIAKANIADKKYSESLMKDRDWTMSQRALRVKPGWEKTIDMFKANEYFHDRGSRLNKLVDENPNGHTREWMPWETKPEPAPKK